MRQINDYFDSIPHSLQMAQLTTVRYKRERTSIIERILRDRKVKDTDYKGIGDVKVELLKIYAYCCAFCESRISKYDDAEHFRPKHAITGVNTDGYYWLAVEWSNLLIACKVCNNDYKQTHFPITGTHILPPIGVLKREIQLKRPFSAIKRSCIMNFKAFFIDEFTGEQEAKLNRAYTRLKADF